MNRNHLANIQLCTKMSDPVTFCIPIINHKNGQYAFIHVGSKRKIEECLAEYPLNFQGDLFMQIVDNINYPNIRGFTESPKCIFDMPGNMFCINPAVEEKKVKKVLVNITNQYFSRYREYMKALRN